MHNRLREAFLLSILTPVAKKIFYIHFIEELVGITYKKNTFSIASLFCNSITFMLGMSGTCMFINFGLLVGCWLSLALHFPFRTKIKGQKLWGSPPASASQTRTSTLHVCPFQIRPQRSLYLNLNQEDMTAIPEVQIRTSQTGRLCVRPLHWRSTEVNRLMAQLDRKVTRRQSQRSASMVIKCTVGPASKWEAPDDAPKFALAPTTWKKELNHKHTDNFAITLIFKHFGPGKVCMKKQQKRNFIWRPFRKEDILGIYKITITHK